MAFETGGGGKGPLKVGGGGGRSPPRIVGLDESTPNRKHPGGGAGAAAPYPPFMLPEGEVADGAQDGAPNTFER